MKNTHKTRAIILSVSKKLFLEKGYLNTSVMDIANNAQKAKGSIYYYFDKKEDILTELYSVEINILKNHILELLQVELPFTEKLEYYLYSRMEHFYQSFCKGNDNYSLYFDSATTTTKINTIQKEFELWEKNKLLILLSNDNLYTHSNLVYPTDVSVHLLSFLIKSIEKNLIFKSDKIILDNDIKNIMHIIVTGIINP